MVKLTPEQWDIKERWVEALRSGRYRQGKYWLCTHDDRYCGLGVLWKILDNPCGWVRDVEYGGSQGTGFPWQDISVAAGGLADLNDDYGWSFAQIADAIDSVCERGE